MGRPKRPKPLLAKNERGSWAHVPDSRIAAHLHTSNPSILKRYLDECGCVAVFSFAVDYGAQTIDRSPMTRTRRCDDLHLDAFPPEVWDSAWLRTRARHRPTPRGVAA